MKRLNIWFDHDETYCLVYEENRTPTKHQPIPEEMLSWIHFAKVVGNQHESSYFADTTKSRFISVMIDDDRKFISFV